MIAAFLFLLGMLSFLLQHFQLSPLRALPLLPSYLLYPLLFLTFLSSNHSFHLIGENLSSEIPVQPLITLSLTFHLDFCRDVLQIDAGGGFIDFLTALPTRADKLLHDILLQDAKTLHLLA